MSKLLRLLREKTPGKERFYKYILYAIGEVVLIVVGILVAVSIGNWNDSRKNRQATDKIVTTISDDLREDIEQFEFLLRRHYWLDSVLRRVLNGTLTEQDYRSKWRDLHPIIVSSVSFYTHKNGYTALQNTIENTPDNFHEINGDLTNYYQYTVDDALYILLREDRLAWNTIEDWAAKYEWNYETRRDGAFNSSKMDYLLHSPEYKNKATTFLINTSNTIDLCETGRYNAVRLYLRIADYREVTPDSTYNQLKGMFDVESTVTITACDGVGNEPTKPMSSIQSILLIRNRSKQPARLIVSGYNGVTETVEIPAASVDFYEVTKGNVVMIVKENNDCIGYFKVGDKNLTVEL